jgi:hypothetical protein
MMYVSAMQYYAYLLHDKKDTYIHLFQRLYQQWIVDMYSKMEGARINFLKFNQASLRADLYQNIKSAALTALGYTIGKRIVLPSTFKGCDRYFAKLFQDGMAVIREYGKPDLFITVTCNPRWPEITAELNSTPNEHKLTIINRVFKLKLKAIMDDLYKKQIFGSVKSNMYVIEFQKRGLPHAHILIIMEDEYKPRTTDDYDLIVQAEIPDKKLHPKAYETVTKSMIHGPCGILNPGLSCMKTGI